MDDDAPHFGHIPKRSATLTTDDGFVVVDKKGEKKKEFVVNGNVIDDKACC